MTCSVCQKRSYSAYCVQHKPRKPIAVKSVPKQRIALPRPTKAIKKHGKIHKQWMSVRGDWLTLNPTPWRCHYCDKALDITTIVLDHKAPRSSHPALRFDLDNLVPACFVCNTLKGSIHHDRFDHDCKD